MSEDGYEHPSARYRAMVFGDRTPEESTAVVAAVTAAFDKTFGVKKYTTTEGWIVGGIDGNGEVNKEGPRSSPAWRQRIDKARREIEEHKTAHRVSILAASLRPSVVTAFLRALKYE